MAWSHTLGFPRIGERRELKKATEAYWAGDIDRTALEATGSELRRANWARQHAAGIDQLPVNDFSFYDHVLDMSCLVGNVPARFEHREDTVDLDTAFAMARGTRDAAACEMTKWFDTNYHYLVPEFTAGTKVFDEWAEARALGYDARPVLVGPATYLWLGKVTDDSGLDPFESGNRLAEDLIAVYQEILERLASLGADWVQLDEPILALDLSPAQRRFVEQAYARLSQVAGLRLMVATYFGELRDNLTLFAGLPVAGLHIDAVRGVAEAEALAGRVSHDTVLSLGLVDGRNVWKTDLARAQHTLTACLARRPATALAVGPSCSLLHSPICLANETALDACLMQWLAFADEKLTEIVFLANAADQRIDHDRARANERAQAARRTSVFIHDAFVQRRLAGLTASDYARRSAYPERARRQHDKLALPLFPTTTIGSFPQTQDVRRARAGYKAGRLSAQGYETFLAARIDDALALQEDIGLDMLVHGEFERNDMVEYFGEQLAGYAFTRLGWVQSYGTRYVKPPIIYGDVSRPAPMTVKWSRYAQSRTARPLKGMLTGPVTLVQWAFVRDDQPWAETVRQVALAIRDEVCDLEAAGLSAIQIDEAAFREGLPLRRDDWADYLATATAAFRLATAGVADTTQIHTHMCYSQFNDIIEAIAGMDADCISIETARSQMALLDAFAAFEYPNEIGPGVYDIHSPCVPEAAEMSALLDKATQVLAPEKLWVNPDCGLKTRGWAEVEPALRRMVEAARQLRRTHAR